MADDISQEGTVAFFIQGQTPDWFSDKEEHRFPEFSASGIAVRSTKLPNRKLHIEISGPFRNTYDFTENCPDHPGPKGVHVAITWKENVVSLSLNGKRVKSRHSPRITH